MIRTRIRTHLDGLTADLIVTHDHQPVDALCRTLPLDSARTARHQINSLVDFGYTLDQIVAHPMFQTAVPSFCQQAAAPAQPCEVAA